MSISGEESADENEVDHVDLDCSDDEDTQKSSCSMNEKLVDNYSLHGFIFICCHVINNIMEQ